MLLLTATTDTLDVITGAALAVDVHVSYMDYNGTTVTPGRQNTAITTAATTAILAAPASSTQRNAKTINIRNKDTSASVDVTVRFNQNGTAFELYKVTLLAGNVLSFVEGIGFFVYTSGSQITSTSSTADQSLTASAANYLAGSALVIPTNRPIAVGTLFRWHLVMSKTAAGTAAMTFDIRFGVLGTTGDTSRATLSTGTQTAVADVAHLYVQAITRGPIGATCLVNVVWSFEHNLAATGFGATANIVSTTTTAAFDVTTTGMIVGLSATPGASEVVTVQQVSGELINI